MGNSSSKDSRHSSRPNSLRHASEQYSSIPQPSATSTERLASHIYTTSNRNARGSRPDLSFLSLGGRDRSNEDAVSERPRETKQEREARRAERERQARLKERERSIREEHVDGGYLVTLGTYTGPEDFNKPVVRQLQIERRLAPFWTGLNDHSDSWTEIQLVAAARGLPIPAADEVPQEMARTGSQASSEPRMSDTNVNSLTIPIASRSQSYQSDASANLSASHPAFSSFSPSSLPNSGMPNSQLFRGRAKTLASFASGKGSSSSDPTSQEIRLPNDSNVHGQPIEAYLYKDASECPICFLYYPPYLNRTRCCDQPICSECFVQIKRPDPHPPEHEQPGQTRPPEEETETLVSEIAVCPFCVTPDFGVSYEPPPFRRGLAYANQHQNALRNQTSATSSTTSLTAGTGRRRATSLSANAPNVITTDRVRPDWAKKLADARANALRRSAAATALHNAAYVLGNPGEMTSRGAFGLGRRRRTLFSDSPGGSGSGSPREGTIAIDYDTLLRVADRIGQGDDVPARGSSRRHRAEDLEDLMIAEAIRLSLAAEEERRKKEEKEAQKDAKKKAKETAKEEKKAAKLAKRNGSSGSLYRTGTNDSSSSNYGSVSMARSGSAGGPQPSIPEEQIQGKGKQPVHDLAGSNPLHDPTFTLNTEQRARHSSSPSPPPAGSSSAREDPQRHLAESRANLQPAASSPIPTPSPRSLHLRQLSNASSIASSFVDSAPGSYRADSNFHSATDLSAPTQDSTAHRSGTPPVESMFNFRSLAAMVDQDKQDPGSQHIENAESTSKAEEALKEPSPTGSPRLHPAAAAHVEGSRSRGDSGESSASAPPPIYVEQAEQQSATAADDGDDITPAPQHQEARLRHDPDRKDLGNVNVLDRGHVHEATQ